MRKAFTLAEILVSLALLAVITSIAVPVVISVGNDANAMAYKAAFKSAEDIGHDAVEDWITFPTGVLTNVTPTKALCNRFLTKMNVLTENSVTNAIGCPTTQAKTVQQRITDKAPNFINTNGMAWYGMEADMVNDWADGHTYLKAYVDVDGPNKGANTIGQDILGIRIREDGQVTTLQRTGASIEETYLVN
ncbi:MAG: prepilin-type N-terminal cleavage/methylation domain-containing protein [bacterium]